MPVVVVSYDPQWPTEFQNIKAKLVQYLEGVNIKSIEHVGSTSVPGLHAKAIIDIAVVVDAATAPAAIAAIVEKGGYTYLGDRGIPDRYAFDAPEGDSPPRNLYVNIDGCTSLRNQLGLRRVLRGDAKLREEYGAMKLGLAAQGLEIDDYVEGKSTVIQKILAKAGLSNEELETIFNLNRKPVAILESGSE